MRGSMKWTGCGITGTSCLKPKRRTAIKRMTCYFYFQISSDGETVTVENEKGVGFVNEPVPTPHQPGDPSSPPDRGNSHILLWIILASGSLAMLVILSIAGRKKRIKRS